MVPTSSCSYLGLITLDHRLVYLGKQYAMPWPRDQLVREIMELVMLDGAPNGPPTSTVVFVKPFTQQNRDLDAACLTDKVLTLKFV